MRWKLQKSKKSKSKLVNCLKMGAKKAFINQTCSEIDAVKTIYNGKPKLLKAISWHSRGKLSTVSGDSSGYSRDRVPIGGSSLSNSSPLLRSSETHTLVDGLSTLSFASLYAVLHTTFEGPANLALHNIAHIERSAGVFAPPAPQASASFVVVALPALFLY